MQQFSLTPSLNIYNVTMYILHRQLSALLRPVQRHGQEVRSATSGYCHHQWYAHIAHCHIVQRQRDSPTCPSLPQRWSSSHWTAAAAWSLTGRWGCRWRPSRRCPRSCCGSFPGWRGAFLHLYLAWLLLVPQID